MDRNDIGQFPVFRPVTGSNKSLNSLVREVATAGAESLHFSLEIHLDHKSSFHPNQVGV